MRVAGLWRRRSCSIGLGVSRASTIRGLKTLRRSLSIRRSSRPNSGLRCARYCRCCWPRRRLRKKRMAEIEIFETLDDPPIRWARNERGKILGYALTEMTRPHQAEVDAVL